MVRKILGVVAGFLLDWLIVGLAGGVTMVTFGAAFTEVHEVVPIAGLLILLVGDIVGAFAGAWLAMRIGRWNVGVWIAAVLMVLVNLSLASTLIGAAWLMIAGVIVPLAAAALITRMGAKVPA